MCPTILCVLCELCVWAPLLCERRFSGLMWEWVEGVWTLSPMAFVKKEERECESFKGVWSVSTYMPGLYSNNSFFSRTWSWKILWVDISYAYMVALWGCNLFSSMVYLWNPPMLVWICIWFCMRLLVCYWRVLHLFSGFHLTFGAVPPSILL